MNLKNTTMFGIGTQIIICFLLKALFIFWFISWPSLLRKRCNFVQGKEWQGTQLILHAVT